MNTNESPSLYRYCIVLVSTSAGSSFSPERRLRSSTAPVSRFFIFVRVNAAPLPGLTNWNSTTVYGAPSSMILRPLRMSEVSYMRTWDLARVPQNSQVTSGLRRSLPAVGVLEADHVVELGRRDLEDLRVLEGHHAVARARRDVKGVARPHLLELRLFALLIVLE